MEKAVRYKEIIKNILTRYVDLDRQQPAQGVEYFLISDDVQGHYLWTSLGWSKGKRNRYVIAHLRVRDDKIWIEADSTENGIAEDLVEHGIPKSDIVLAFHEPAMRQFTEFSIA